MCNIPAEVERGGKQDKISERNKALTRELMSWLANSKLR